MLQLFIAAMLIVPGIIHLLPLSGVLGAERLASLYGIAVSDGDTAILLRHRAVSLGLLGAIFIVGAFQPSVRMLAFVAGLVTVVSFLWLAWSTGGYSAEIRRVVIADVVALACLVLGLAAHVLQSTGAGNELR